MHGKEKVGRGVGKGATSDQGHQKTRTVGRGAKGEHLLCRLPEMPGVRQAAVSFWQFLQHVHELGEGRSLLLFKGPAEEKNVLKRSQYVII